IDLTSKTNRKTDSSDEADAADTACLWGCAGWDYCALGGVILNVHSPESRFIRSIRIILKYPFQAFSWWPAAVDRLGIQDDQENGFFR
ncbi:MAG TPA: hypothetical protein VII52_14825, partial [Gemmatimonadaceae bacterium]